MCQHSILPIHSDVTTSAYMQLKHLDLDGNYLRGTLPKQWSTMQNLQFADLSSNNFNGSIPSGWSNWTQVSTLCCQFAHQMVTLACLLLLQTAKANNNR